VLLASGRREVRTARRFTPAGPLFVVILLVVLFLNVF
jgi:hypothetical protein